MQGHGYIKVKGIIIADADGEEHEDQIEIVPEADAGPFGAKFVRENEAFGSDKGELAKGDEVTGTWIMSVKGI